MAQPPETSPPSTETPPSNPAGTDGLEFIEYAAPDPAALGRLFEQLGFTRVARHRSKQVDLFRQGDIHFVINAEPGSFGQAFARVHGPSVCALGFRVADAAAAYRRCTELGAWGVESQPGPMELAIPAIKGVGDSLIYLVDRYGPQHSIWDVDFVPLPESAEVPDTGLLNLDHLTHNVHRGRLLEWADFYERLFGFREIRYFDITGRHTGLKSKAMTSPCGRIRIPINESSDDQSQIQEYLEAYKGEGIQHIALSTNDIHASVEALRQRGIPFLTTPDTYYEKLEARIGDHGEDVARLQRNHVLIDGNRAAGEGLLLQIFTDTLVGPIFFEIIERKGNEGFGEGNFQALFEAMEEDQLRRGVLS